MPSIQAFDGADWDQTVSEIKAFNGANWDTDVKTVHGWTGSAWQQLWSKSDPITGIFDCLAYSEAYYGNPGLRIGTGPSVDGDKFLRWGWTYNSQIERSIAVMTAAEKATLVAQLTLRPIIKSVRVLMWVHHTQNGAAKPAYVGWTGASTTSSPTNFSRLHTETHSSWSSGLISIPHNDTSAGTLISYYFPSSTFATLQAQMLAGNVSGITLSYEAANDSGEWGWLAGRYYTTAESGGVPSGSVLANTSGTNQRVRFEVQSDYV